MKWYLDFGHGGRDSGAIGSKRTKESDKVLQIGMLVKNNLEKACEDVITTRESDTYHSLEARVSKANKENCHYFVSIHLNSATNKSAKGCEVWVYDKSSRAYSLSQNICTNLSKAIATPNRGVKISKDFYVLRNTKMSALLIEVDFISNSSVESSLGSSKYISDVANSISSTLLSFVGKSMSDDFYRVCIGAFRDRNNAVRIRNEAISKGFKDTYIL